jgi:hypothetical protein
MKIDARARDVVYTADVCAIVAEKVREFGRARGGEAFRVELAGSEALRPIKMLIESNR